MGTTLKVFLRAHVLRASRLRSRRACSRIACALLVLIACCSVALAQADQTEQLPTPQITSAHSGYTLRVTTREVLVEVVARDRKGHAAGEFSPTGIPVTHVHRIWSGDENVSRQ
jgi:hypothetical protein